MGRRTAAQTKRLIARNIRRMRQDKSWSQHDLANEAGVRQALISSLEIATANPTLESLDKVAGALNVGLADLLSDGAASI
jgi:transcriptional regulator with XRE-family HTH domain